MKRIFPAANSCNAVPALLARWRLCFDFSGTGALLSARANDAASDRIRFGIIGIGMPGSGLLRDAIHCRVECVAACDLYDGRHTLAQEIVGKKSPPPAAIRISSTTRR